MPQFLMFTSQYIGERIHRGVTYCPLQINLPLLCPQSLSLSYNLKFFLPPIVFHGIIYEFGLQVEDHGLSSIFFPFLVAEEDVCSEIRMLEGAIDVDSNDVHLQEQIDVMNARNLAMEFLHEMGWFLRRSQLMSRVKEVGSCPNTFPLTRFWWLMSFAVDREWSAVVKKLLDLLFQGIVDLGNISPSSVLSSSDLLHSAVRKKCKSIVEVLLRYAPTSALKGTSDGNYLFRPDMPGPLNITPLHIAASSSGAENILDSLTNDPGQVFTLSAV